MYKNETKIKVPKKYEAYVTGIYADGKGQHTYDEWQALGGSWCKYVVHFTDGSKVALDSQQGILEAIRLHGSVEIDKEQEQYELKGETVEERVQEINDNLKAIKEENRIARKKRIAEMTKKRKARTSRMDTPQKQYRANNRKKRERAFFEWFTTLESPIYVPMETYPERNTLMYYLDMYITYLPNVVDRGKVGVYDLYNANMGEHTRSHYLHEVFKAFLKECKAFWGDTEEIDAELKAHRLARTDTVMKAITFYTGAQQYRAKHGELPDTQSGWIIELTPRKLGKGLEPHRVVDRLWSEIVRTNYFDVLKDYTDDHTKQGLLVAFINLHNVFIIGERLYMERV